MVYRYTLKATQQTSPYETQGLGPQGQQKWINLQLPVPSSRLQ